MGFVFNILEVPVRYPDEGVLLVSDTWPQCGEVRF